MHNDHFLLAMRHENSHNYGYLTRRCPMAYRALQTNKKTGVTYVYEAVAVWDKEKKQPRSKRVVSLI